MLLCVPLMPSDDLFDSYMCIKEHPCKVRISIFVFFFTFAVVPPG